MSRDNNLYNQKWQKFLGRVWLFNFIPFVDFVLAAGSLATGNINKNSDFDVIIGARQGRIFTVRMLCFLKFRAFGWWARHPDNSKDKLCFNHFITPKAYQLSPPHNDYWKNLYKSLVPVYGDPEAIQKFYDVNQGWMGERRMYQNDKRHIYIKKGIVKRFFEWRWFGIWADWLEKALKAIQIKRIESSLKLQSGYKPRIIYNDNELEFHPDTKRTENAID